MEVRWKRSGMGTLLDFVNIKDCQEEEPSSANNATFIKVGDCSGRARVDYFLSQVIGEVMAGN